MVKLTKLMKIEEKSRNFWEKHHMFELDAPSEGEVQQPKYLTTFPYPYLNGKLHLGHTFTLTKCEFAAGYQRLKGKRALFPFAFHATGMPIAACADKLKIEIANGVPQLLRELKARQPELAAQAAAALAEAEQLHAQYKQHVSKHPKDMAAKNLHAKVEELAHEAASKAQKAAEPSTTGGVVESSSKRVAEVVEELGALLEGLRGAGGAAQAAAASAPAKKEKAGRSKEKARKIDAYQWEIMQMLGLQDDEIPAFTDAIHWLKYFPPIATADLQKLGVKVDWRRAFTTTDENPYYDAFIRWQFNTLHAQRDKIAFGKRYTVWSPSDNQPCMDHDRASGEGVKPTEYTAIKLRVAALSPDYSGSAPHPLAGFLERGVSVFLVAATMRPETMVGQTNCWVHPDITYGVFATASAQEVVVMTERSATNMAYQSDPERGLVYTREFGKVERLGSVTGRQLIGCALAAPRSPYERVWVLPMLSVLPDVGTGIVTSVPSDAPADYAALRELQRKPDFRALFGVREEWLLAPIPIISIPELGDSCAIKVVEDMEIASPNDPRLSEAKDLCYRRGFAQGVMLVGEFQGQPVQLSKDLARKSMVAAGEAFPYAEPGGVVVSRSGDTCVVCLADQWYYRYGDDEWRARAKQALQGMRTFGDDTYQAFERALDWLNGWPLSRTYGTGSRIPWDPQFLIESLSDSTIYNAYYAVAGQLQGKDNLFGKTVGPSGIRPEQLTHAVWDYIFLNGAYPAAEEGAPPKEALDVLRREFAYWLPTDMRVSGKELIQNHLTFYLYNNVALFPEEKWPKGVRANGHLLLDNEKMSKSKGNFMTLDEAIARFGSDPLRWTLAAAGDGLEDANFETTLANKNILRLFLLVEWYMEVYPTLPSMRDGDLTFRDLVFEAQMDDLIQQLDRAYEETAFRTAAVLLFEFLTIRDTYRFSTANVGMHRRTILRFLQTFPLLISPFCPHTAEHLWQLAHGRSDVDDLQPADSVLNAPWPKVGGTDPSILKLEEHIVEQRAQAQRLFLVADAAAAKAKKAKPTSCKVFIAQSFPEWQEQTLTLIANQAAQLDGKCPDCKQFADFLKETGNPLMENKKLRAQIMAFAKQVHSDFEARGDVALQLKLPFNEFDVLTQNAHFLKPIGCPDIEIVLTDSEPDHPKAKTAQPGKPSFAFQ